MMDRRKFLRRAGAISVPLLTGMPGVRAMGHSLLSSLLPPSSNRVLVLVQLSGGNDGLNTLVPLDQLGNLQQVRPNVYMPQSSLRPITTSLALHGRMAGMQQLFNAGKMSIVQDVGYPNQNRSHFRSTDIWTSASDATTIETTGWTGRYLEDADFPGYPTNFPNVDYPHPAAISMGNVANATCQGMVTNLSQAVNDPFDSTTLSVGGNTPVPNDNYGDELSFLRTAIEQTNEYGIVIRDAASAGSNSSTVTYPANNWLAQQLKNVALLISGGLQTQVYVVNQGGYDTHASQINGATTDGRHADLLQDLSEAITAFQDDLEAQNLADRVLGMTFSEFGRRIRDNASMGTDHGTAAPLFLFGNCVSGTILGNNPTIDTQVSQNDGVPMQYDFRDVYGSVLVDWFGVTDAKVRTLLYPNFVYLPIASGCTVSLPVDLLDFTASGAHKQIDLAWQTASETDNAGFDVERSTDGQTFRTIGFVPAPTASTENVRDYQLVDRDVVEGPLYYYRLKQRDIGGNYEYSPVRTARLLGTAVGDWSIGTPSPNPATTETTVQVYAPVDGRVEYSMFDLSGRRILSDSTAVSGRRDTRVTIPIGRVPAGIYTLRFTAGKGDYISRKLVVQ